MAERKIMSLEAVARELALLKRDGRKVVQCHGCFDLLHIGHIKHLQAARRMGDALVVTITPARGHVQPLVPLAHAARAAGHDVAFAVAGSLAGPLENAGFVSLAAGFEPHGRCPEDFAPGARIIAEQDIAPYFVPHLFVEFFARVMLPDLLDICRMWRPDLIVRENCEFAACVAAEMLDLPYVSVRASAS